MQNRKFVKICNYYAEKKQLLENKNPGLLLSSRKADAYMNIIRDLEELSTTHSEAKQILDNIIARNELYTSSPIPEIANLLATAQVQQSVAPPSPPLPPPAIPANYGELNVLIFRDPRSNYLTRDVFKTDIAGEPIGYKSCIRGAKRS
jgi:hypothetical protein